MIVYAPNYYNSFKCIADRCTHNCCIGWEIDIDIETYNYYKSVSGEFGKRLRSSIQADVNNPHFILDGKERCPFLNESNLCDIILQLGEDKLCNICTDHPRFRNYFDSRVEMGIGISCEEAARLVLTQKEKTTIVNITDEEAIERHSKEEEAFFNFRNDVFKTIQDRSISVDNRINRLITCYGVKIPQKSYSCWADVFIELEHMDCRWTDDIKNIKILDEFHNFNLKEYDTVFEQLIIYFLYRHMSDGLYDGRINERIAFSIIGYKIIKALAMVHLSKQSVLDVETIVDFARRYSSEIEYSEDNTNALIEIMAV